MNEKQTLVRGLEIMGLGIDELAVARLVAYCNELKKWNRKVNLIARDTADIQILENHFLDSLTVFPLMQEKAGAAGLGLMDVGTGAGFPGLVLKVVCPWLDVTLVEPRQKRVFFLRHLIRTLGLEGVEVLMARLDGKAVQPQLSNRKFSFITSRALTDTASFLAMAVPYLDRAGLLICMKGPKGLAEVERLREKAAAGQDKLELVNIRELQLPFSGAQRYLLVFGRTAAAL